MTRRTKLLTIMAIAGIGALVLWSALVTLLFVIHDTRDSLALLHIERTEVYTRDVHGAALRALARDTHKQREQLSAITGTRDVVEIIRILEDVSVEAGVEVLVNAVSTTNTNDAYETLIISLGAEGTFSEVTHAFLLLETPEAATAIDHFELNHVKGDTWRLQVRERVFVDNGIEL